MLQLLGPQVTMIMMVKLIFYVITTHIETVIHIETWSAKLSAIIYHICKAETVIGGTTSSVTLACSPNNCKIHMIQ